MPPPDTDWSKLHGDAFAGRTVCVTGGCGFIGSHVAHALITLGANVRVVDDLSTGSPDNLPDASKLTFHNASILNSDELARAMREVEFVFHLAALGSVPHSLEVPLEYHEANATGTLRVLESARAAGARRVIYSASSSAYGDAPELPKHESMAPHPQSPYAASKLAGEHYLSAWAHGYQLQTVSLRYFNIFGPRQNANSAYAAVIAAFAKRLLNGEPPAIFGDGTTSRDFTYVDNAVHANLLAATSNKVGKGEVINVATARRVTLLKLATLMSSELNRPDLTPEHAPERPGDIRHSEADLTRARELLNYGPLVDFETGLAATLDWYRQNVVDKV